MRKLFLSTYVNKIDAKGRVSIPAAFRTILEEEQENVKIIIRKSFLDNCIEVSSLSYMEKLSQGIDNPENVIPQVYYAFLTFFLFNSAQLTINDEVMVLMPKKLLDEVGITSKAIFVGKDRIFETLSVDGFYSYTSKVKEIVKQEKSSISFIVLLCTLRFY
ncbi:MAG: hypothetical protein PV340_05685 [Wolbachia sp.]|nr:hypothetical protein [Wolbachia sp.]MDD9336020.1 hypothetical protein [Wolbachia sp.]